MASHFHRHRATRTTRPLVVVIMAGRAVCIVVVLVLVVLVVNRRMMVIISITNGFDLSARSRMSALHHQQTTAQPGKNAKHEQPCHKSKHGAKKHQ